eukprot:Opistho-2@62302
MPDPEVHQIVNSPISCHAWNKDRSQIALCPNTSEIHIYKRAGNAWERIHTLRGHDQRVMGLDWAATTNRIASCGQDRNAYVWTEQGGQWKPTLVILRINRAATQVKWSPKEDKFAVASGARLLSVCYFEEENDWWVSKHIKKPIRSTVLSIDWHPNNVLIACGSSDFKARIFSGYIKERDEKPKATCWGSRMPFGECLKEFSTGGGWVHSVAFSASGDRLAFVTHDAAVAVVNGLVENHISIVSTKNVPYKAVLWLTENSFVAAGHDNMPTLWTLNGANLSFVDKLDQGKKAAVASSNAMSKFRDLDKRATSDVQQSNETVLPTIHQNTITELSLFEGGKDKVSKFTTVGVDGRIVVWDVKSLEQSIAGLKVN